MKNQKQQVKHVDIFSMDEDELIKLRKEVKFTRDVFDALGLPLPASRKNYDDMIDDIDAMLASKGMP